MIESKQFISYMIDAMQYFVAGITIKVSKQTGESFIDFSSFLSFVKYFMSDLSDLKITDILMFISKQLHILQGQINSFDVSARFEAHESLDISMCLSTVSYGLSSDSLKQTTVTLHTLNHLFGKWNDQQNSLGALLNPKLTK